MGLHCVTPLRLLGVLVQHLVLISPTEALGTLEPGDSLSLELKPQRDNTHHSFCFSLSNEEAGSHTSFGNMTHKCGISEPQSNFPWSTVQCKTWHLGFSTGQNKASLRWAWGHIISHFRELVVGANSTARCCHGGPQLTSVHRELSWGTGAPGLDLLQGPLLSVTHWRAEADLDPSTNTYKMHCHKHMSTYIF